MCVRALVRPRWMTVCSRERSKSVTVRAADVVGDELVEVAAGTGCSFHAHELTTSVRFCAD
jgi:hypothetical protein